MLLKLSNFFGILFSQLIILHWCYSQFCQLGWEQGHFRRPQPRCWRICWWRWKRARCCRRTGVFFLLSSFLSPSSYSSFSAASFSSSCEMSPCRDIFRLLRLSMIRLRRSCSVAMASVSSLCSSQQKQTPATSCATMETERAAVNHLNWNERVSYFVSWKYLIWGR